MRPPVVVFWPKMKPEYLPSAWSVDSNVTHSPPPVEVLTGEDSLIVRPHAQTDGALLFEDLRRACAE